MYPRARIQFRPHGEIEFLRASQGMICGLHTFNNARFDLTELPDPLRSKQWSRPITICSMCTDLHLLRFCPLCEYQLLLAYRGYSSRTRDPGWSLLPNLSPKSKFSQTNMVGLHMSWSTSCSRTPTSFANWPRRFRSHTACARYYWLWEWNFRLSGLSG